MNYKKKIVEAYDQVLKGNFENDNEKKEENLKEIKSRISFKKEDPKDVVFYQLLESEKKSKKFKKMVYATFGISLAVLIGSNVLTYFLSRKNTIIYNDGKEELKAYFSDFEDYSLNELVSKTFQDKYTLGIYQGTKNNQTQYVYYLTSSYQVKTIDLKIEVTDTTTSDSYTLKKEKKQQYAIGTLMLEDLQMGTQLDIELYENDVYFTKGSMIL